MAIAVETLPVRSFDDLGEAWRALEAEAGDHSFFQSWTWVGCLAAERYDDPVLLRATEGGRVVGLGLFNRRDGRLHLAESGRSELDAPFTEHNAPLVAGADGRAVLEAVMAAAWRVPGARQLVLGGVPDAVLHAAGGIGYRLREEPAPFVDLDAVRRGGQPWIETLSANTRYQIRRSARVFGRLGPVRLDRAERIEEARDWLEALARLHGESWRRRGQPGAFANPFSRRFHQELVERATPRGELDLLRLSAGGTAIGYLYNFRLGGRVYAYQSGLDPARAEGHGKPGLTCHAMAVERAIAAGERVYDFLAGAARYKLSLSNASEPLFWAEAVTPWSLRGLLARARRTSQRLTGGLVP
jgi:CelD/BcsL family acetyltransferase involved in cellulose biosynthesis